MAKVGVARLWKGGEREFTEAQLLDAVRASKDAEIGSPRVKLAHEHQLDTGEPAFGRYEDLRYDAESRTVFADLKGVPLWLAKVLPTFYPNRSFEAVENAETASGAYSLAFKAIGSLGIKMPAIKGLADLAHWATEEMPDGVQLAAAEGMAAAAWADTSIENETEELTVDIRKTLDLPEDATDEQVTAKLDELAALAKAGSPEALQKVRDEALAQAQAEAQALAAAEAAEAEAAAAKKKAAEEGAFVQVEAAAFDELKAQAAAGAKAGATLDKTRRTELLDRKIGKGAIAPASKDSLLGQLEAGLIDEDTIEKLPEGVLPIDATTLGQEDKGELDAADGDKSDDWMSALLTDDERAALKEAAA